jgi:hypothetical protein
MKGCTILAAWALLTFASPVDAAAPEPFGVVSSLGCLGHWTYINYSPNKALGIPNGGGDGRMRWSRTGALCRIALHANSRFTMLR